MLFRSRSYKKYGLEPRLKLYEGGRHEILNELNKSEVYEDFLAFLDWCEAERVGEVDNV